ncbi:hypothetical protein SAICODRAFT_216951 [Saitoella complicata NRRL Y-17804]|uniref:uncharacterized protein n=1 Tax=Saitoella complicata (strain BCRC 22490 / CBS 7301 / JCM 7358 / NBRC 10748 / NRRL Y-17804) TaxID=698492 RepID=UPI0008670B55|nr:uncharacterized protein SAICODRAFT_216951 [Saitoella complicata NRRL Y-17804]ODQ54280.1 hypothetical protein SAICODRAFT_216951 [Saitoella complicata NRRL Y-17804]
MRGPHFTDMDCSLEHHPPGVATPERMALVLHVRRHSVNCLAEDRVSSRCDFPRLIIFVFRLLSFTHWDPSSLFLKLTQTTPSSLSLGVPHVNSPEPGGLPVKRRISFEGPVHVRVQETWVAQEFLSQNSRPLSPLVFAAHVLPLHSHPHRKSQPLG